MKHGHSEKGVRRKAKPLATGQDHPSIGVITAAPAPAVAPRTLMVFVDGLGCGGGDPAVNPLRGEACPVLRELLARHARPIDAGLDTPGLPQSATGQATLLTGVNAARIVGRHVEGFPGPAVREVVRANSIFRRLTERGYRATFANAYFTDDLAEVKQRRHQSVTTVAALSGLGAVRDRSAMARGEAVYHDLTREALRARGYEGPLVSPEEAAKHLLAIATAHDFTLFEFFRTDRAGHRRDRAAADAVLAQFDRFLAGALRFARGRGLLVLTSDHGNIEDLSTPTHTRNPVPFVALGRGAPHLRAQVHRLQDFVPALLALYPPPDR